MDKPTLSTPPKDKMDRLIYEAQQEGLFHGRLKRSLLAGREGHQQSIWMQHAATAMIVGVLVGLAATWMGWPVPVVVGIFCVFLLAAAISFAIGAYHLVRYMAMEARVGVSSAVDTDDRPAPNDQTATRGGTG